MSEARDVEVFIRRDGFCFHRKAINTRCEGDTLSEFKLKWLPKFGLWVISLRVNPMGMTGA